MALLAVALNLRRQRAGTAKADVAPPSWSSLWPWLVLLLVVASWEALGIDTGRREPHLTISALAGAFRWLDAALMATWMLLGAGWCVARSGRSAPARAGERPDLPRGATTPGLGVIGLLLPSSRLVGVAFFVCWAAACVGTDLVARRTGRFIDAGELARLVGRSKVASLVCAGAWAYAGWHLFAH